MESDIMDRLRRYFVTQRNQWNAADEIKRLRKERDEARRLYCVMRDGDDGITCKEWADRKGWDCFKEDTND